MTYPEPDKLWKWTPNWSTPYQETWQYKTDVITSRSGSEQRRSLRATPRKSMEYSASVFGDDAPALSSILDNQQAIETNVIDLPRKAILAEPLAVSATSVNLQSVPRWVFAGLIVAVRNGSDTEIRKVQSISGNLVTFTYTGQSKLMPAGSYLHPAIPAHLKDSITSSAPTNAIRNVSFGFESMPGYYPPVIPPVAAETYKGLEVFSVRPNWVNSPQMSNDIVVEEIDFDSGRTQRFTPILYGTKTLRMTFTKQGEAAVDACAGLFERSLGRRNPFFSPTWQADMAPVLPITSGSTTLTVRGASAFSYLFSKTHRSLYVALSDSTHLINTVTSMEVVDGDTVLTLETAWPSTVEIAKILFISWMPVWRFSSDQLTISWLTDNVAQFQLAFQMLEDTVS